MIILFGFKKNLVDDCIYHKLCWSNYIFLLLYVDDILLASNDIGLLHYTKRFLSKNFEMKDLCDTSFVLGIQIHCDHSHGILGLSSKSYIETILKCKIANQVPLWLKKTSLVSISALRMILRKKKCRRFLIC